MSIEWQPLSDALRSRTALLRFTGILSLKDVAELKSSLKRLLRDGFVNLLLDLEDVRDIDEAGWAVLVSTVRKLRREGGRIVIRACPDALYERLQARNWDRDFLFPMRRADHLAALPQEMKAYFQPQAVAA